MGDGGAKDQAVNDDDDEKDYAEKEYASGKGVKDVANKDAYGNEKEVASYGKTDGGAKDQAVNDDDDVKDYAEEEYAEAKAEEWEQQADGSWVNTVTGQTYGDASKATQTKLEYIGSSSASSFSSNMAAAAVFGL